LDSRFKRLALFKILILTIMKVHSIFFYLISFLLGALLTYFYFGRSQTYNFEPVSHPITFDYAQELIENYNCGNTRLSNTDGVVLKGWHLEKHLIDSLFRVYADRDVSGLQVYLGKHEEADNTSHTLIWMAVKDTIVIQGNRREETMKLLIDQPNTIFQYVKPCPINCPKNDFSISCGG
jgi:hypothetical protein